MLTLQDCDRTGKPHLLLQAITPDTAAVLSHAFAAMEPWSRYAFSAQSLTDFLALDEADAERYAVMADAAPAGAIVVRKRWMRGPYLQFLGVLPAFQRHGIGRLCLAWFEGSARAANERNIWVAASDFNGDALRFYERHGFTRVAQLDGLIANGITEILLRKRL